MPRMPTFAKLKSEVDRCIGCCSEYDLTTMRKGTEAQDKGVGYVGIISVHIVTRSAAIPESDVVGEWLESFSKVLVLVLNVVPLSAPERICHVFGGASSSFHRYSPAYRRDALLRRRACRPQLRRRREGGKEQARGCCHAVANLVGVGGGAGGATRDNVLFLSERCVFWAISNRSIIY